MSRASHSSFSSSDFPAAAGVYLMKNEKGKILYIGKAKNLRDRLKSYFFSGRDERATIPYLIKQVVTIETILVPSEKEALILENTLIKKHKPKYNILLKDDKTFLSLMLNTSHPWPMLKVVRLKGRLPKKDLYFGPYTNAYAARQTLELLRTLFPLRQCSDQELRNRTRPCILYDMQKCIAPCCAKCTKEEYTSLIEQVISFLKGHDRSVVKTLTREMQEASDHLDFEKAGRLYKLIQAVEETTTRPVFKTEREDIDVFALARAADRAVVTCQYYREGRLAHSHNTSFSQAIQDDEELLTSFLLQHYEEKEYISKSVLLSHPLPQSAAIAELIGRPLEAPKRGAKKKLIAVALLNAQTALEQSKEENHEATLLTLEEHLHLTNYPERIECVDQSHLSGSQPVSAIITFLNGIKSSKDYRTYNLKAQDDYGGLEEVLRRRFRHPESLPDLLLIDGGKGHLNLTLTLLGELNISTVDVVAIAKEEGRHDKGSTREKLFLPNGDEPILLHPHSKELFFLQRIRDEAHRFVLNFQKKQRKKRQFHSELDDLPGIGPIKKKRLLAHFGSLKRLKEASEEEWLAIKGITNKDCVTLKEYAKESLDG